MLRTWMTLIGRALCNPVVNTYLNLRLLSRHSVIGKRRTHSPPPLPFALTATPLQDFTKLIFKNRYIQYVWALAITFVCGITIESIRPIDRLASHISDLKRTFIELSWIAMGAPRVHSVRCGWPRHAMNCTHLDQTPCFPRCPPPRCESHAAGAAVAWRGER